MITNVESYLSKTPVASDGFTVADLLPTRRNILKEVERSIFTAGDQYVPFSMINDVPECTEYALSISPPSRYNILKTELTAHFHRIGDIDIIPTSFGNVGAILLGMTHGAPRTSRNGQKYVQFTIKYRFDLPR